MLKTLHSERFEDQTARKVYAELLYEGSYLASPSTMYRILAERGETRERRNQREARSHAVPRLEARAPNQVWTWDISKLATKTPGTFLNLYLVLDLFSRYPVAWMVAERENSALAKQLFATAIKRYDVGPRVSNDNPFSESCFKTIKYQPDYPGRFRDVEHAPLVRRVLRVVREPPSPQRPRPLCARRRILRSRREHRRGPPSRARGGYARHPERFVKGPPRVRRPPAVVAINPLEPTAPKSLETLLDAGDAEFMAPNPTPATDPQPVLPGAPTAAANPT